MLECCLLVHVSVATNTSLCRTPENHRIAVHHLAFRVASGHEMLLKIVQLSELEMFVVPFLTWNFDGEEDMLTTT